MANKKQFLKNFKGASVDSNDTSSLNRDLVLRIENKYFNLFCSSHQIDGDVTDELRRYIYRRFWIDGTICFFAIDKTNLLGACKYAPSQYDMYNEVATVLPTYINGNNTTIPLVPHHRLTVNKDCVIGWYQRNHEPMYKIVHSYATQLADIEMTINTNLQTHKLPFTFNASSPDDLKRLKDAIQSVLQNETSVAMALGDANSINSIPSNTPYIIDKLYTYKCDLENELKTYLGLNNSGVYQKASHTLEAEVESSQQDVNDMLDNIDDELNELSERIKNTLNRNITFKRRLIPADNNVEHMDSKKMNGEAYND